MSSDEYMTPSHVWKMVLPFIPKDGIISEPFYGDGASAAFLQSSGLFVFDHKGQDFFKLRKRDFGDVIVTNPPFSLKSEILQRLKHLQIPFMIILPTFAIHLKTIRELFGEEIQIIIPPSRIHYRRLGQKEDDPSSSSFESCFFCWRLDLPRDINFIYKDLSPKPEKALKKWGVKSGTYLADLANRSGADIVMTNPDMAKDLLRRIPFEKGDVVLEPGRGKGAFFNNFPTFTKNLWCEISEDKDFFDFHGRVDYCVSNPPFTPRGLFWNFQKHAMKVTTKAIYWVISMSAMDVFTPKRYLEMNKCGWYIQSLHVVQDKRWYGRYIWVHISKNPTSFFTHELKLYGSEKKDKRRVASYINQSGLNTTLSQHDFEESLPDLIDELETLGFDGFLKLHLNFTKSAKDDWNDLIHKSISQNSISAVSRTGLAIVHRFMPHIYDVENYRGISISSLWDAENINKVLRLNRSSHSTPYSSEILRQLGFKAGLSKVTVYRPLLTKRIVSYYRATNVLDISAGWGSRMLGTLCLPHVKYTGIEPCLKTFAQLVEMAKTLKLKNVNLFNARAEDVISTLDDGSYDVALTSPPYYNLEIYSHEETQSSSHTTYEDWVRYFLKPVVKGVLKKLKHNGKSIWNVKNFKTDNTYNLFDDVVMIHQKAGWSLSDTTFDVVNSSRPACGSEKSVETTYVFLKTEY